MTSAWSDEQRFCLAALGYAVYQRVAEADPTDAHATEPADMHDGLAAVAADPSADDANMPVALWRALLRAALLEPLPIEDATGWLQAHRIPPLEHLLGDPSAKRASWPIVRALRRTPPTLSTLRGARTHMQMRAYHCCPVGSPR